MSGIKRSRERVVKNCKHCSIEFSVANYRKDTAMFCSRRCMALESRQQCTSNCSECGNQFDHISSRANKAKYCSFDCYYKAMGKKGKTQYNCAHCNIGFLGALSQQRKYCSRACTNKASKDIWKPDFTTVRKKMVSRNMLLACERCGYDAHTAILGVHHKDRDRKNNELSNLEVLCPNCHSLEHSKHTPHGFRE